MLQPKKRHGVNGHQSWLFPVPGLLIVSPIENLIHQGQDTLWGVILARRAESTLVPATSGTIKTLFPCFKGLSSPFYPIHHPRLHSPGSLQPSEFLLSCAWYFTLTACFEIFNIYFPDHILSVCHTRAHMWALEPLLMGAVTWSL